MKSEIRVKTLPWPVVMLCGDGHRTDTGVVSRFASQNQFLKGKRELERART
jgi:hypothetical protein